MKFFLFSAFAVSMLMTSCSTTSYSYRSTKINGNNVLSNKTVVDSEVDLSRKITTNSSKRSTPNEAIEEAYYKAIVDNNVDFIVDPIFEVSTSDKVFVFGGKSVAKLTGWGGKYSNSRSKIEAINELSQVDTLNIEKFNAIYTSSSGFNNDSSISKPKGLLGLLLN